MKTKSTAPFERGLLVDHWARFWYDIGMKSNTSKSSITLPPDELKLVNGLMKTLGAKSKVEVIRRGLRLLKETTDRQELRKAYLTASESTRESLQGEMSELEPWDQDGI